MDTEIYHLTYTFKRKDGAIRTTTRVVSFDAGMTECDYFYHDENCLNAMLNRVYPDGRISHLWGFER